VFDAQSRLGFGTYTLTDRSGTETIEAALDTGYRHVDTARLYGNEHEVGKAIEAADVGREDVFVATKVAHFEEPEKTEEYVQTAIEESFERLGLDRIDLLYHHWPRTHDDIKTVLPIIAETVKDGSVGALGVSNYTTADLDRANKLVDVPISALQVEMHPFLQQSDVREYISGTDTELVAYAPLAQGAVFDDDTISDIAEKHDVSESNVSLAWLLEKGVVPIPRTSSVDHLRSNLDSLDVDLDSEDIQRIDSIKRSNRCVDPDWMTW